MRYACTEYYELRSREGEGGELRAEAPSCSFHGSTTAEIIDVCSGTAAEVEEWGAASWNQRSPVALWGKSPYW
jgi:hypothetical protein